VLRALLALWLGFGRATQIAASIGQGLAFALGFIGLLYNPLLVFVAIFVYLAAAAEAHQVQIREVATGVMVSEAMITQFAPLTADSRLDDAVRLLLSTTQHEFPVVDHHGRLLGVLTRDGMIRGLREHGPDAPVVQAMQAGVPTIDHRMCLDQAFRVMRESQAPAVGVTEASGRLAGLVTPETIAELMMVWSATPERSRRWPWGRRRIAGA
jgi:CBS domain-containing protein